MHIPDGIIDDTRTLAAAWAGSAGAVGYAVRRVRLRTSERRIVLMSITAALIFALQLLNFPVAGGTSGHFAGATAAAVLLGPWAAVVVMSTVLVVQAFVFTDGGIVALGANVLNLAVVATFAGWLPYAAARRLVPGRRGMLAGAALGGWLSVMAAALAAGGEIVLSGRAPAGVVLGSMAFWHALIGIGEGAITAGLVGYVLAVRPDLLEADERGEPVGALAGSLALLAVAASALSFLASAFPDGLETVLGSAGVQVTTPRLSGVLSDYLAPGVGDPRLAVVLAGLAGAVLTGGALFALVRGRREGAVVPPDGQVTRPELPSRPSGELGEEAEPTRAIEGETGFHRHGHSHEGEPLHAHPHHHTEGDAPPHEHAHAPSFESPTWIVSPVHRLDPRTKIAAALMIVAAVVLAPLPGPVPLAGLVAFFLAVAVIARLRPGMVLARSALVLPFAGTIALLAPLSSAGGSLSVGGILGAYGGGGWIVAAEVIAKSWLAATTAVLLSATTPVPDLFRGMERLHVPRIVVTMLSFLYRYADVMGRQLLALRRALDARGWALSRLARLRLYGHLAGNMFVRAYERGERVHAAMASRGYTGTLPSGKPLTLRPADGVALLVAALVAAAVLAA